MLPKLLLAAAVAAVVLPASAGAAITRTSVLTPGDPHYRAVHDPEQGGRQRRRERDDRRRRRRPRRHRLRRRRAQAQRRRRQGRALRAPGSPSARSARANAPSARCRTSCARRTCRPSTVRARRSRASTPRRRSSEAAVRDYVVETGPAPAQRRRGEGAPHRRLGARGRDQGRRGRRPRRLPRRGRPAAEIEGRPAAPGGYEGVHATVHVDERTNDVTVTETEPVVTCDEKCLTVHDTGVKLVRTVTFTEHHAVSEVRDQWVSTDGRPHRIRLTALHGTPALWRFPGTAGVRGVQARPERAGERPRHDPDPERHGLAHASTPRRPPSASRTPTCSRTRWTSRRRAP